MPLRPLFHWINDTYTVFLSQSDPNYTLLQLEKPPFSGGNQNTVHFLLRIILHNQSLLPPRPHHYIFLPLRPYHFINAPLRPHQHFLVPLRLHHFFLVPLKTTPSLPRANQTTPHLPYATQTTATPLPANPNTAVDPIFSKRTAWSSGKPNKPVGSMQTHNICWTSDSR